jgi:hypothetical protein
MATIPGTTPSPSYPASLSVDYPDRQLNRLTSFFRIITIIPIAIIAGMLANGNIRWGEAESGSGWSWAVTVAGILFLPTVLMILFRQKYPRWWFDWNFSLTRFSYRVSTYFALLRDEYPSTDEEQSVHINLQYPDVKTQLGRGWPLIKWFLLIPHYFVIAFLGFAAFWCVVIAWFAILFTGRYPRGLFDFVVSVMRWGLRIEAYGFILITDRYPPFSLEP